MTQYRPYPEYTDGCIFPGAQHPESWEEIPLRRVIQTTESGTSVNAADWPAEDGELGVLKTSAVYGNSFRPEENKTVLPEDRHRVSCPLRVGSLIVSRMNTPDLVGAAGVVNAAPKNLFLPDRLWQISFNDQVTPKFVHYWSLSDGYRTAIKLACTGTSSSMQNLSQDQYRSIPIAFGSELEQKLIVETLDRETACIDALIEKKTRFIELLKEKRQALITQAVTKGLDPTVPMRDSGVEWIGEVPAHWKQTKLRYIVKERSGKTPSKDNGRFWDGDVPWVTPKDMKIDVIETSLDKITDHAVKQCGMTLFEAGTILVVVRGMILAHSFPVAETSGPVTVNQDMKALKPCSDVEPTFLRLLLQSLKQTVVDILVAEAAHGTRVLRTDIWKQLPLFLPTIEEQKAIIQRVEFDSERVDSLVDATNRSINLLKERRSALITAAVTGQIDLREEA